MGRTKPVIEAPRFPALDPEPPRPSGWRRASALLVVAAVGVAIVMGVLVWPKGGTAAPHATSLATNGAVVVWRGNGSLAIVLPDGTSAGRGMPSNSVPEEPVPSLDGRFAIDIAGDLWALGPTGAHLITERAWGTHVVNALPAQPFAADDGQLVVGGGHDYDQTSIPAQFRDLRRKRWSRAIGVHASDVVVGDPSRPAAFVVDPHGLPVFAGDLFHQPTRRLDYVNVLGRRRAFLTDQRARRALGLSGRVEFFPWPEADGSRVAVRVAEITGNRAGVIVLGHAGQVVGAFSIPSSTSRMAWSRTRSLAVVTSFPDQLLAWRAGNVHRIPLRLPFGEQFGGRCLWSPDATVVLCPTFGARGVSHWLLVRVSDGRQQVVPAPGLPIAWQGRPSR